MLSREEKNMVIKEKGRNTRLKRRSQTCKTFKFKINKSSLKRKQLESLKMFFVETKRVYNYLLNNINNGDDIFSLDYRNLYNITYLDKDKNVIEYKISYIGAANRNTKATNIIRGLFSPYIGLEGTQKLVLSLVNIRIPNYDETSDYFSIRYRDAS